MRCPRETQDDGFLVADAAGALGPREAGVWKEHVAVCPACRDAAARQRTMWRALDDFEAPPVPPDFDRRLYQRIEKEVSRLDRMLRPFRPLFTAPGVPLAVAATILVAAAVLIQQPLAVAPADVAPESAEVDAVAPELAEPALQEMEMLRQFSQLVSAEPAQPKM